MCDDKLERDYLNRSAITVWLSSWIIDLAALAWLCGTNPT